MPIHRDPIPPERRRRLRQARPIVACALAVALVAAGGSAAGAATMPRASVPVDAGDGHYLVTLKDQPAATYDGTLDGLARTKVDPGARLDAQSDAVERYSDHLSRTQHGIADSVGATPTHEYSLTTNGFSADLTAAQVRALGHSADVLSVEPDQTLHMQSTPATRSLGLEGDRGLWAAAGGVGKAGAGTVIADIDSGIAPDNPSFAGKPLGTTPGAEPYRDGKGIAFRKADGSVFHGTCETGDGFTAADCSTKLIGARSYIAGRDLKTDPIGPEEKRSPRDTDGHGTHTASTAAGNADVTAVIQGRTLDTIAGVAPAAKIAAYKVCWDGPDPDVETDDGCQLSDIIAAIDQATADGADVINMSLGSDGRASDEEQRALLGAASAGVFVAASAGNSGPDAGTVANMEPWITTVAASSVPDNYSATVTLGDGRKYSGGSITVPSAVSGPLVRAADSGVAGAKSPELCGKGTLDPAKVTGRIVQCDRGVSARIAKSAEVRRAGGIGMVLTNVKADSEDLDTHTVPTVHLDVDARDAVVAYAAKAGATATLTPGNTSGVERPAPQVTGFSSRGPESIDDGDIIKPDITAPGAGIPAAYADVDGKPGFAVLSGTSMSSPHIAGFALDYLGLHPKAAPAEIKSAMMTTATDTVDAQGKPVTDPFAQGAGEIAPGRYLHPGLVYASGPRDWAGYAAQTGLELPHPAAPVPVSDLNLPSIAVGSLVGSATVTRTVTSQSAGTWTASVQGVTGADVKVTPARLSFTRPGQTRSFQVRVTTKAGAALDAWTTGSLTWSGAGGTVRSPVAVRPRELDAPSSVSGSGTAGEVGVTVTAGVTGRIGLTTSGLAQGQLLHDPSGPKSGPTGSLEKDEDFEMPLTVAAGEKALVLDATPRDGASDLALLLQRVGADGKRTLVDIQLTPSLSERIVVPAPEAGDYVATVEAETVAGSAKKADFDLTRYDVGASGGKGAFAVTPAQLRVTQGRKATYAASWSGLDAGSRYVGLVSYTGSDATTLVDVTTPAAAVAPVASEPPVISGTPDVGQTLTASTGTWTPAGATFATQWLSDGKAIGGATGSSLRVTSALAGTALTARVTATAPGGATGVATSAPVTVRYAPDVRLTLTTPPGAPAGTACVEVAVRSGAPQAATGTASLTVDERTYRVPLDGSGTGRVDVSGIQPGDHSVEASYPGDHMVGTGTSPARTWHVAG
ncbi:S8 family serine peptidase [Clavibacter capsici]|uniref:S8 family serine peptidase n=1 Tax=Clavibacter capsici TaxID=1874630 RepID=A0AAE6XR91_9MICO|nr:S8 family serine peptidase [Clavibacter capsici]ALD13581.1 serine protease [Clavibacter capsici]QIS45787.1 S8 family serine peptidase [Clavibacter capsici]